MTAHDPALVELVTDVVEKLIDTADTFEEIGGAVLDAIAETRWELVELPERDGLGWPVDPDDDDFRVEPVTLVRLGSGEHLSGCKVAWGSMEMNVDLPESRKLAAALLAAARAAESGSTTPENKE